ncbi:hypothetical protein F2Q70_00006478 [Brassica cretica]|uniref:Formin-like protein n=1 Tax=Brassica cretica TaxID=69181 RepID=A0A8S9J2J3_BRACR|nr:hypothetical protein F2Q70_00006478 [Brassica cretica]
MRRGAPPPPPFRSGGPPPPPPPPPMLRRAPPWHCLFVMNYSGDKATLGNCEQYFLELMKVPRVESKLRVFSLKVHFGTQISELKQRLDLLNSACDELRSSQKLKEIMKRIDYLGNTHQGPARGKTIALRSPGVAVGFKLKNLLKVGHTRGASSMQHLCKDLASKESDLMDFHKDHESLESASKIQLKSLDEDMQAIIKGLNILNQELTASESDGPASKVFHKLLKEFVSIAETEVASVSSLYSVVGENVDALVYYVGENPIHCPFEQVTADLVNFVRLFKKAHEENIKQAELEKKEAAKDKKVKNGKGLSLTRKVIDPDRADNLEIMLWRVKMPLPDMMAAVQAMDDTVLDIDQIEKFIRFCPTKEEMELLNRLKNFMRIAETEVEAISRLYTETGRNADALAHYFGEDPSRYPFEQVTGTLAKFISLWKKTHEENVEQAELEKMGAAKEARMKKAKEQFGSH